MNEPEVSTHLALGREGEQLARRYLRQQGYQIVLMNFTARLGRSFSGRPLTGEIDIVAYEGTQLCFIEVKTRRDDQYWLPEEAVNRTKQRQIARVARRYRQLFGLLTEPYRFDVVAIVWPHQAVPQIRLQRDYFCEPGKNKRAFSWQRLES
ncbi:MAG: YraN family protein [Acidobacteriota bacterium]